MKPKFLDYNIVDFMDGSKQREMDNQCCVIRFDDKTITITIDKNDSNKLSITKSNSKDRKNGDRLLIEPTVSNSITIS